MMRVNLLLLLLVMLSAVYLVNVQYESRRLFTEIDRSEAEGRRLSSDFERLQVEKRAQATPARVEKIAREKLQMRQLTPSITTYVNYTAPAVLPQRVAQAVPVRPASAPLQGGNP